MDMDAKVQKCSIFDGIPGKLISVVMNSISRSSLNFSPTISNSLGLMELDC